MADSLPEEIKMSICTELGLTEISPVASYSGGMSGAIIWLAWSTTKNGLQKFLVVKADKPEKIKREVDRWKEYARFLNRIHAVQLVDHKGNYLDYDCASQYPGNPQLQHREFKDHYNTVENPAKTIKHIFKDVLNPWYLNKEMKKENLRDTYNKKAGDKTGEIIGSLNSLFNGFEKGKPFLDFSKLTDRNLRLKNPVYVDLFPESGDWDVISPESIIHGDLNLKNILIFPHYGINVNDKDVERKLSNILCVIDFYYTGQGTFFEDIALLESCIKFQIFKPESIGWNHIIDFESSITDTLGPGWQSSAPVDENAKRQLQKLYNSVKTLREEAFMTLEQNKNFSSLSYWVYLYIFSLKRLLFKDITDDQKRYAFISACMIFDKHIYKHAYL